MGSNERDVFNTWKKRVPQHQLRHTGIQGVIRHDTQLHPRWYIIKNFLFFFRQSSQLATV